MKATSLLTLTLLAAAAAFAQPEHGALLAQNHAVLFESPDPQTIFAYTPGLAVSPTGRLIATMDIGGPGAAAWLKSIGQVDEEGRPLRGRVYTSDDHGTTWTLRGGFPFLHARPFVAGDRLYVLGHAGDLMIIASSDDGQTWSKPHLLTHGQQWHASATNVLHKGDRVYLVMEKEVERGVKGWKVASLAPILMRGDVRTDLTHPDAWTFADELVFYDAVDPGRLDGLGVPFYPVGRRERTVLAPHRAMYPIGWLEANVVQIHDPNHLWFDPDGRTFYLFLRAHTGKTNLAALAKVVEAPDGSMTTSLVEAPSGKRMVFLPFPGGHMRFHVLFDEPSGLYWLLASQATDSMTRPDALPDDRFGLPDNERHRLGLWFSRNMVDWCFAGLVARGGSPRQARHYASMVVDGDDLHILSRSGDERARSAHDGNLITFHTVRNFRDLAY